MLHGLTAEYFMRQALQEAQKAFAKGEIPVGAVVVLGDQIIARMHNQTEQLHDVTAHAEIMAITAASSYLNSKFLPDCKLYVTLEPCVMCAGALYWSRIGSIIYGATDEKRGFLQHGRHLIHPKTKLANGILEAECSSLMRQFFRQRR